MARAAAPAPAPRREAQHNAAPRDVGKRAWNVLSDFSAAKVRSLGDRKETLIEYSINEINKTLSKTLLETRYSTTNRDPADPRGDGLLVLAGVPGAAPVLALEAHEARQEAHRPRGLLRRGTRWGPAASASWQRAGQGESAAERDAERSARGAPLGKGGRFRALRKSTGKRLCIGLVRYTYFMPTIRKKRGASSTWSACKVMSPKADLKGERGVVRDRRRMRKTEPGSGGRSRRILVCSHRARSSTNGTQVVTQPLCTHCRSRFRSINA